jgi:hypothetical protein
MPTRFIPISEDEQKIAALIDRVFTDQKFAQSMHKDPVHALQSAGYTLTDQQKEKLQHPTVFTSSGSEDAVGLSLIRPAVRILTRGTRPVTNVITKGTQPAVQVAVNSVIAVKASSVAHLVEEVEAEEPPEKS